MRATERKRERKILTVARMRKRSRRRVSALKNPLSIQPGTSLKKKLVKKRHKKSKAPKEEEKVNHNQNRLTTLDRIMEESSDRGSSPTGGTFGAGGHYQQSDFMADSLM